MSTISIYFNGEPRELPAGASLQEALALFAAAAVQNRSPMASALNGRHIAKDQRAATLLSAGDHVTTFEPITGG